MEVGLVLEQARRAELLGRFVDAGRPSPRRASQADTYAVRTVVR